MAEVINPEQFISIRKLEIGDDWLPEEIWENLPLEEIQEDYIEQEIRDIGLIKREKNKEKQPNKKQRLTIQKTKSFYEDVTDSYYSFLEDKTKTPLGLLLQYKILQPYFHIAINSEREKILREFGMEQILEKDSILLNFKLPPLLEPPLSEEELSTLQSLIDKSKGFRQLDTHVICKKLRRILWKKLHKNEEVRQMKFSRINNVKEHDPKNYYYIWEVSLGNKSKKELPHS